MDKNDFFSPKSYSTQIQKHFKFYHREETACDKKYDRE